MKHKKRQTAPTSAAADGPNALVGQEIDRINARQAAILDERQRLHDRSLKLTAELDGSQLRKLELMRAFDKHAKA